MYPRRPRHWGHPAAEEAVKGVTSSTTIAQNADRIQAYRQGLQEGKRMSKLGAVSDRIVAKKIAHDKKADEWAARLDALDESEKTAFAFGDGVISERETDVKEMQADMRKISNLPNGSEQS